MRSLNILTSTLPLVWAKGSGLTKCVVLMLAAQALLLGAKPAQAGLIAYTGDADPTTEGFTASTYAAPSTVGPVANDLGLPAWTIVGTGLGSQFGYLSGPLSDTQQAGLVSQGFTLTLVARVLQNPNLAPAVYDSNNQVVIGGALVSPIAGKRFEVDLGLDSSGDTVAVLPTSISSPGPGQIVAPGPSYTLTGEGDGYHTYELVYNPTTQLANLLVDGIDRIDGYAGHTSFVGNYGLVWSAFSGGQANFNLVELNSAAIVPEPSAFMLLGVGAIGLIALPWRRRRRQAT